VGSVNTLRNRASLCHGVLTRPLAGERVMMDVQMIGRDHNL
jgi:hypothetical protein